VLAPMLVVLLLLLADGAFMANLSRESPAGDDSFIIRAIAIAAPPPPCFGAQQLSTAQSVSTVRA